MKMEIKYCERCGAFLGTVNPRKKYCTQCKRDVSREQKRARRKALSSGRGFTPVKTVCQWCGKPMIKMSVAQKYHKDCAKDAAFASIAEHQRLRKERDRNKKALEEKKIPSVGQVQALADKWGKHYGEVSQMLATGELAYEW
jgi:hypothetical protein